MEEGTQQLYAWSTWPRRHLHAAVYFITKMTIHCTNEIQTTKTVQTLNVQPFLVNPRSNQEKERGPETLTGYQEQACQNTYSLGNYNRYPEV